MLVTCLLPARGRPDLTRKAMDCFVRQTYSFRELLILDDLDCPAFSEIPKEKGVRLIQLPKMTIGQKRNIGVSRAEGNVICHWDSDDWFPANRIETQLRGLLESGKRVSGCREMLFWDLQQKKGYRYLQAGNPKYAIGTSLMYYRDWATTHPFPSANIGEDNMFVHQAQSVIHVCPDLGIVAGIHAGNTSCKVAKPPEFRPVAAEEFPIEAQEWMF